MIPKCVLALYIYLFIYFNLVYLELVYFSLYYNYVMFSFSDHSTAISVFDT